ncbi:acyl-CoA oxidase [Basidiobolus meristosporus CBS 931.73]|uniref:Acyl-coenzyme A oxidase n=1 Tax=Basidiobolus meristosporus CBS 931.73 TaxID=1314790 RepID=A0A1Y1Z342_9FUNG|nr:acyl-CoA oxidase [Basidiobolus meristosporus CBS 931.73]|eukprot:ORY04711.1 acyl-CoA oxidase [Basidiobolus meristosporus CBS 931.73]
MTPMNTQPLSRYSIPTGSITEERGHPSFNVRELTYFLDGGEEQTKLNEKIMSELEQDPLWNMEDQHTLSLPEIRERTFAKVKRFVANLAIYSPVEVQTRKILMGLLDPGFSTRFGLHFGIFLEGLKGQSTPEQIQRWAREGALDMKSFIGCFSITELGHGSNLAGLETTATYDQGKDEFVINTPSVTATKWWIGNASHTATHSIVYAQLIVQEKRYGVHAFVVPLRDPATYIPLPGISIGDIGKKMGRDGIDNGWIQFDNVRIPRDNMLMKHTQVTHNGEVARSPLPQLAYGALINGRVGMVRDSTNFAKKALTIAIRYAVIRRQFSEAPGRPETKILDYLIHQNRLLPLLAQTFAIHFTSIVLDKMHSRLTTELANRGNSKEGAAALKEMHATSAGLKAFCTWSCLNVIESCRQACGGHGYSAYTGLASLYQDFAVQCTWEGDNTILALQAGRFLINSYQDAVRGKEVSETVGYLKGADKLTQARFSGIDRTSISLEEIGEAWCIVATRSIATAYRSYQNAVNAGNSKYQAMECCAVERLHAARMHSFAYIYKNFLAAISEAPISLKPILEQLCLLYGLHSIQQNSGQFLASEYFEAKHLELIDSTVNRLCLAIRRDAVPLVDSFNYSDHIINSPLGRFDGNAYSAYFDIVRRNNAMNAVPPYLNSLIKPIFKAHY